ncbi:MAG: hypothetical protein JWR69_503 [Pedosphaera sp.]|nr:hypothetical protein [Pedosphaera sp.]
MLKACRGSGQPCAGTNTPWTQRRNRGWPNCSAQWKTGRGILTERERPWRIFAPGACTWLSPATGSHFVSRSWSGQRRQRSSHQEKPPLMTCRHARKPLGSLVGLNWKKFHPLNPAAVNQSERREPNRVSMAQAKRKWARRSPVSRITQSRQTFRCWQKKTFRNWPRTSRRTDSLNRFGCLKARSWTVATVTVPASGPVSNPPLGNMRVKLRWHSCSRSTSNAASCHRASGRLRPPNWCHCWRQGI